MNAVEVKVEPARDYPDMWYWAVLIEGETYADGEAASGEAASLKAAMNLDEWQQKQT